MRVQAKPTIYWTAVRGQDSSHSTEQRTEQSVVQHAEQQMAMDVAATSYAPDDLEENEPAVDAAGMAQSPSIEGWSIELDGSPTSTVVIEYKHAGQVYVIGGSLSGSVDELLGDSHPTLAAMAGGARPPWPASDGVLFGTEPTPPAIQPWPPDPGRVKESW